MGRNKKEIKKKNISLSINNDILLILDKYLDKNNLNRSEFIESLWKEYIENNIKN
jgi:metal-responsive CopG/Arc/MetJ family transcriptional regulator